MPFATASSQNPQSFQASQSPQHLNSQYRNQNSQADMNSNLYNQPARSAQPTTPPRTPRKDTQPVSQNTSNSIAPETGSKQRSRNKNRPKNVMTSPAAVRKDRNTPPLTGAQSAGIPSSAKPINTPSTAVYAGSTFHASPAPSALPMPSFYSKSVPDSPGLKGLKGLKALKDGPLPTGTSTPARGGPSISEPQREESPLDVFFKADREEKARARSASSNKTIATAAGPFLPPLESPRSSQTPPGQSSQTRFPHGTSNRMSSSGMFAMELDGDRDLGTPYGPAFSTPYSERINAARSGFQSGRSPEPSPRDLTASMEQSQALKAYLFSSPPQSAATNPSLPSGDTIGTPLAPPNGPRSAGLPNKPYMNGYPLSSEPKNPSTGLRNAGRSSGLRQEVTPTKTPTGTPDHNNKHTNSPTPRYPPSTSDNVFATQFNSRTTSDVPAAPYGAAAGNSTFSVQHMEDSLRRILKMDSTESSGSNVGQVQAASVSAPGNVGGRPPPMNWQA